MQRRTLLITTIIVSVAIIAAIVFAVIVWPYLRGGQAPTTNENTNGGRLPSTNEGPINVPVINLNTNVNLNTNTNTNLNTNVAVNLTNLSQEYGVDEVASGSLTETTLVEQTVAAPQLAGNGRDIVYHDETDGRFFRLRSDGTAVALSDAKFFGVTDVTWAPASDKAILTFPDDSKVLYNFTTKKQLDLPYYWEDFNFSPTSDQFAFKSIGGDEQNQWLSVANADGSNIRAIEPMGANAKDVTVMWSPDKERIAVYSKPETGETRELIFIGLNGENYKSASIIGQNFVGEWTPDGEQLLYSTNTLTNGLVPELYLIDARGDDTGTRRRALGLRTWANRCAFSPDGRTAYCGVPTNLQNGAAIDVSLQKRTKDVWYQINLTTGSTQLLARPATISGALDVTVKDPFVTGDGRTLYFEDADTNTLHAIQLKN